MHNLRVGSEVAFGAIWGVLPGRQQLSNSERLLQRGRGMDNMYVILVKGESMESSTYFCGRFLLVSWNFSQSWETLVTMKDFSAFLDMRSYKNCAHRISSWEDLTTKDLSCQFAGEQRATCLLSTLNSFRALEVISCSGSWFNPYRGRWQAHSKCQLVVDISEAHLSWKPKLFLNINERKKKCENLHIPYRNLERIDLNRTQAWHASHGFPWGSQNHCSIFCKSSRWWPSREDPVG